MKKDTAKKPSAKAAAEDSPAKKTSSKTGAAKTSAKAAGAKIVSAAKGAGKGVAKAVKAVKAATALPAQAKTKTPPAPATIVVHHDAGWGNTLHLRGEGPGLSWDSGKLMCCVQSGEWVWVAPAAGTVCFKILLNDTTWSLGENLVAGPGETITVNPVF